MTLHEAIEKLLKEKDHPMTTKEIADELNKNGWYVKKNDNPIITPYQIHGRTKNYPRLFHREGSTVSLINENIKLDNIEDNIGIPEDLIGRILWNRPENRKSPLSFSPGVCDIVIEYSIEPPRGYTRLKYPSAYIKSFLEPGISKFHRSYKNYTKQEKIALYRKIIKRIFIRKSVSDSSKEVKFEEVWNSKASDELPWEPLQGYEN